ncbi:MAG: bifunctional diaminohydroxyphosphoribosylaminopyrimidine deaminase/5-amino-6-(5-phosphoribosylamino)uracil reductase RibD [Desulfobaccales bacterium]|jgi:diaminohydroxyphosphoribosylaminopyrimidine deaminase/5-amino-6-(5-phosphoribosylamino)uracil reductase
MTEINPAHMKLALRLAAKGAGWVSPNPMVGAVLVQEGRVVGRGFHRRAGAAHAEVAALEQAGAAARGADLYVTLEPCNHQGRTPPCTEAILAAGVARVIIATPDPNPQVAGAGAQLLQSRGVTVEVGLLAEEARSLNQAWFHWLESGRPWVIAKAACSLDGKIATAGGQSQWLTGEPARAWGHRLRHQVDAILVGIETVLHDDPQLTTRLPRQGQDPIRIVLDSTLRIPLASRLLHLKSPAPTWVACTNAAPADKIGALKKLGAEVLIFPGHSRDSGRVPLPGLMKLLGARQVQSLLVEGGAEVLGAFFEQKLVNQFFFFFAPKFLGGRQAPGVLGGEGIVHLKDAPQARDLAIRRVGADLLIKGYL